MDSFNSEKIKNLLSYEKSRYQIIKPSNSSSASWWRAFGYPARLNENNQLERITGFISCFKCMNTQVYNRSSGSKHFKEHADKCFPLSNITTSSSSSISFSSSSTSSLPSSTQTTLNQNGFTKHVKLNVKDIKKMKDLSVEWVCGDLRPFSILDDPGFRKIAQECVRLGSVYGIFDVNELLRGEKTISRHIISLADASRDQIKELLSISLKDHSLTICPDYWTDLYKKISYLGVNVILVNHEYQFLSFDLCCKQFEYEKKTAENTLKALHKYLEIFGINSLADVNIICDRGSNFVCAFKDFEPIFCFGHRLHNIVKITFFQNKKKKKESLDVAAAITNSLDVQSTSRITTGGNGNKAHESSSDDSESSTDDDCDYATALPVIRKKKTSSKKTVSSRNQLLLSETKITVDQISSSAKHVLQVLNKCKKIVKYVKKTGINNDIKQEGGVTLHQSSIVRWLSMSNLLESLIKSFKATKRLLIARKKQSLINDVDLITIKQLVLLLKPFKHIMTTIQTGSIPSLHMVLLSLWTLKHALSSYESLIDYKNTFCNSYENKTDDDEVEEDEDEEDDELEGITWFRERLLKLIDELFVPDVRHFCAVLLLPKYRLLKNCTTEERAACHKYVREQLKVLCDTYVTEEVHDYPRESKQKKMKTADTLFTRFEDDNVHDDLYDKDDFDEYDSDEYEYNINHSDELDIYLVMQIDKSSLTNNPLDFWKSCSEKLPLLSKLAKRIYSIPATSTNVERQFSSAGLIINQRRTNINPDQVDNILLLRSFKKLQ